MAGTAAHQNQTTDNDTRQVLVNPFEAGEQVFIPAGTTYTTENPNMRGRRKTHRGMTVTVKDSHPGFVSHTKSGRFLSRVPRIRVSSSGGYAKDINITEQIIRMNGKQPQYQDVPIAS